MSTNPVEDAREALRTTLGDDDPRIARLENAVRAETAAPVAQLERVRQWRASHAGKSYAYFTDLDAILAGGTPMLSVSKEVEALAFEAADRILKALAWIAPEDIAMQKTKIVDAILRRDRQLRGEPA